MAALAGTAHNCKFETPQKGVPACAFKTALNKCSERKSHRWLFTDVTVAVLDA